MMKEILPGVFHWRIIWPGVWSLESYYLRTDVGGILIDPIECTGLGEIERQHDIAAIIITVGWHERAAHLFAKRTGAEVFVPADDIQMLEVLEGYHTYSDGDVLPGGLRAIGTPGLTPGEQALLSEVHGGTLFVGDALGTTAKWAPGGIPIGGHPNGHPQPQETLSHLLEQPFENLLPGHGDGLVGGAWQKLEAFIQSGQNTSTGPPKVTWFPRG